MGGNRWRRVSTARKQLEDAMADGSLACIQRSDTRKEVAADASRWGQGARRSAYADESDRPACPAPGRVSRHPPRHDTAASAHLAERQLDPPTGSPRARLPYRYPSP